MRTESSISENYFHNHNFVVSLDWVAILNENTELNLRNLIGYFEKQKGRKLNISNLPFIINYLSF